MIFRSPALSLLVSLSALLPARADILTEAISYSDGETDLVGYLASDSETSAVKPGVIVLHEWWGHNAYAQKRARMLAEEGYVALALDLYGEGQTADHPSQAGEFSSRIGNDLPLAEKRFQAALKILTDRKDVDPDRIAAVGYCFGGSIALNLARRGLPIQAVISVHGGLDPGVQAAPGTITARILVCHGEADALVPMEKVHAFKKEMQAAGANVTVKVYPDAMHSFSNPDADRFKTEFGLPVGYSPAADTASWTDLLGFLGDALKQD